MMNLEKLQPTPNAPQMYPQMPMQPQPQPHPQQLQLQQQQLDVQHLQMQQQQMQMQGPAGMAYKLPQQDERPNTAAAFRPATAANMILVSGNAPLPLGREPQRVTCPECNVKMLTRLDYRCTYRTHLIALVLCVTGLLCFVPLPYCLKSCKNLDHYCSNCDQFMGNTKM